MKPEPGVRVTLVARDVETPYSGMLPGRIAGLYTHDEMHLDLDRLCRFAGARLIHGEAVGMDRKRREVLLPGRLPLHYDVLSLDIGSTPRVSVPGAAEHAVCLKPIARLEKRWDGVLNHAARLDRPFRLLIVGGGAAGAEVALAAERRLRTMRPPNHAPEVRLLTRGPLLAGHGRRAAGYLRRALSRRGIAAHEHVDVVQVDAGAVVSGDGRRFSCDGLLWATQAGAADWLPQTGLALTDEGFIAVDDCLRALNDDLVFAAGDVATMIDHPRPKAGVVAVRQGPPLERNLRRVLQGLEPKPFRPQRRMLALIGTSDGRAIASRGRWALEGRWLWRLKDAIDRRWMKQYQHLPAMTGTPAEPTAMRCAGCGGKLGADVLRRALRTVGLPDIPADAAPLPSPAPGERLVQSVDQFRAPVSDPWVAGRITAAHALGDLHAVGARALTALAVVGLPAGADPVVEADLTQVLAGLRDVLGESGCALSGGHTFETDSLTIGLTVTGAMPAGSTSGKDGLRVGDRLVLTKPLGTGTLFAAAMHGAAKARWLAAATDVMQRQSGAAATVLREAGAAGCTDVTGFGLLGHLTEMLEASGVDAIIDRAAVPALPGALECLAAGRVSTLHPANARFAVRAAGFDPADPRHMLLLDPQTAGGLLAGVPADEAAAVVARLRELGHDAAEVGVVAPRAGAAPRVTLREGMAEADGNRTHRSPLRRAAGFEDQGGHQTPFTSPTAPAP